MTVEVSVVIASYNVEAYIASAIDSVLRQQGVALEVIVVDDASTDGTWECICRIDDPRVRRVRLERNGGPSVARNAGFAMAEGQWIAVQDGDDLCYPHRLRNCIDRAVAAGADIVVDNPTTMSLADGSMAPMFGEEEFRGLEPFDLARFIAGNRLFAKGYSLGYLKPVFRAAFLLSHGLSYDPALRIGEDYLLFAEALASGARCAVCALEPFSGYVYSVRPGSISHRLGLADIDRMEASDRQFLAKHKLDAPAQAAQKMRTRSLSEARAYTMAVDALKRGKPLKAIAAIRRCPSAARYLWWPVLARLERLRGKTG